MNQKNTVSASRLPSSLSLVALSIIGINGMIASSAVSAEETNLDTVVITGEKIDKSIKETTTAVTVITEEQLESGETNQARDVATQAPNVIMDSSFSSIAIRGLSGGGAATGGAALVTGSRARVTTVVDGASQDWSGYNFTPSNLWDVKQVEVLRGPQSTTQGASAIGGAVVIRTNDPTFESEAAVRAGLESYKNGNLKYNVAAMSSGALVEDELAYRIAIDNTQGEGWIDYETGSYDVPNLSESESLNIRGKLLWEPTDTPELSAKLTVNHRKNTGEHTGFVSNTDDGIASQTLDISSAIARVQDSSENSFAIDVDYKLNPGLTNSLHLGQIDSDIYADGYQTSYVSTYDIAQKSTALENRMLFNSSESNLTGVLGVYVANKDSSIEALQILQTPRGTASVPVDTDYTTDTTAAYGEGTYALSLKTNAIVGLRVENESIDKSGSLSGNGPFDQNSDKTYYLPKLGLTHAISDSTTLGASLRKGYSPGGAGVDVFGTVSSFDSEEVTSVEFSSKSNFGKGTTLNANVFYNDYTDYQTPSNTFAILNVDSAHTYGVEVEGTTWATQNLELKGSIGLLQSEVDKDSTTSTNEGNQLPNAPESNLRIGFTQFIGSSWSVGADVTYVGEYYSDLANSDTTTAGDVTITDVRTQYVMGDLTINGYVKNLTDEDAVYYRTGSLATAAQTRTIGLSALYRM